MAVGTTARTGAGTAGAAKEPPAGERRLFLIDGPSLVYRAFYALPESIATSTGEPTNAIFGFASMLVKIVTEYGVCPTLVVWDAGTSGRSEVFSEYKAQRRSRPDLLKQQWPAMEPLVEAFGYGNVRVEGYEADDVIASLAARASELGPARLGDDRDRRPRRPAAGRRAGADHGDGHLAGDHRDEALRPPGGDRPLRHTRPS